MFPGQPGVLEARQRITLRMRGRRRHMKLIRAPRRGRGAGAAALGSCRAAGADGCAVDRGPGGVPGWPRAAGPATRAARAGVRGRAAQQLRQDLALQTAEDVAEHPRRDEGRLMKIGQMASYLDEGLPERSATRSAGSSTLPPMSAALAAAVRGGARRAAGQVFAALGPRPIAAASIGQVHRAITREGRAVAVKVQYPGIAEAIEADLGNVALLRRCCAWPFPARTPAP